MIRNMFVLVYVPNALITFSELNAFKSVPSYLFIIIFKDPASKEMWTWISKNVTQESLSFLDYIGLFCYYETLNQFSSYI